MSASVTLGFVLGALVVIAGVAGVIGAVFFVLSIIGNGFKH